MKEHTPIHHSYRDWDDSDTLCQENGMCVAVRPQFCTKEDWESTADYMVNAWNNHARLTADNAKLRAEVEILLWNLAGCSTYALGHGLEEDHNEEMARPALNETRAMALRNKKLCAALEKIAATDKHVYWEDRGMDQMVHAGTCLCLIAKDALNA